MITKWFPPNLIDPPDPASGLRLELHANGWPSDGPGRNTAVEIRSDKPGTVQWIKLRIPATEVSRVSVCHGAPGSAAGIVQVRLATAHRQPPQLMASVPVNFVSRSPTCNSASVAGSEVVELHLGLRFGDINARLQIGSIGFGSPTEKSGTVNVRDFGAVGDGTSHPLQARFKTLSLAQQVYPYAESLDEEQDWAGIQSALDAGCVVDVPDGRYVLGGRSLSLDGPTELRGAGRSCSALQYWGNDAALRANSGVGTVAHTWAVRDVAIQCVTAPTTGERGRYGLRVGQLYTSPLSAHKGTVENVQLSGAQQAGLHLRASQINEFRAVDLSSNIGDGCFVDATTHNANTDTHFYACTFRHNTKRGLYSTGGGAVFTFHGCTFEVNKEEGARLWRPDEPNRSARNWVFERCYFEHNNDGRSGGPYANFFIDSEHVATVQGHGIWQNIELRRCFFQLPTGSTDRNIFAGRCQLVIWYPEVLWGQFGADSGSSVVNVAIWDDGEPSLWQLGSSLGQVMFNRVRGSHQSVFVNSGGSWKQAVTLNARGVTTEGAVEVTDPQSGVVLTSANGSRWRVTVDDQGSLQTSLIP